MRTRWCPRPPLAACPTRTLADVVFLQIRIIPKQFLPVGIGGHRRHNTASGESHLANTGLAVHLFRVPRNPVEQDDQCNELTFSLPARSRQPLPRFRRTTPQSEVSGWTSEPLGWT